MSEAVATNEAPADAAAETGDAVQTPGPRTPSRPTVIQLALKEKTAILAAYMPFVKGGGLFVPTMRTAQLGDSIYLMLTLLDDPKKLAITGTVIWITPPGVPGRQQGIGIQFAGDETGEQARSQIETLIGGSLKSGRTTHTI